MTLILGPYENTEHQTEMHATTKGSFGITIYLFYNYTLLKYGHTFTTRSSCSNSIYYWYYVKHGFKPTRQYT